MTMPDDKTILARQVAGDLGIEDVDGFLKAIGDQAESEVLKIDPTPWLPVRLSLRLTSDEWVLFQGAPKRGTDLESFLRAVVTFCLTQEPIPYSEAVAMVRRNGREFNEHTGLLTCPICRLHPRHDAGEKSEDGIWLRVPRITCSCGIRLEHRHKDVVAIWNGTADE